MRVTTQRENNLEPPQFPPLVAIASHHLVAPPGCSNGSSLRSLPVFAYVPLTHGRLPVETENRLDVGQRFNNHVVGVLVSLLPKNAVFLAKLEEQKRTEAKRDRPSQEGERQLPTEVERNDEAEEKLEEALQQLRKLVSQTDLDVHRSVNDVQAN